MTIETKFSIGDKVWFKHHGKCVQEKINRIQIYIISNTCFDIRYYVRLPEWGVQWFKENEIASTEEDLLKSL